MKHFWIAACLPALGLAQGPDKVDFARDVAPIFRQNCIGCHGPKQQNGGMRLDRRSSVLNPINRRVLGGSLENSFLYHRLTDTEFGAPMPPTGPLKPGQIAIIKRWIEQGAEWPDSLANESEKPPLNPVAVAMVDMLHKGDMAGFLNQAVANPKVLNARGPEGSTPFMYAALYGGVPAMATLLKMGADPNARNDANATALMWVAADFQKVKLLVEHGADVNAKSDDYRTPLMVAARHTGGVATVIYLLDHGAKPNPNDNAGQSSPLIEAATAGDADIMRVLIEHGADVKAAGAQALAMAITLDCAKCVEMLAARIDDKDAYTATLVNIAVLADAKTARLLIEKGADVNAADSEGRTPLMYAAGSDMLPVDVVKLLIEKGANVNAVSGHVKAGDEGWTVLDIAQFRGHTPVVDVLLKAGAKPSGKAVPSVVRNPRRDNSVQKAVQDSLALLERSDAKFIPKAGCASCHNNSIPAMATGLARTRAFAVSERIAAEQVKANVSLLAAARDRTHQGFVVPVGDNFGSNLVGYYLIGLNAQNYPGDLDTDAVAIYLNNHQAPDGAWTFPKADGRPPICTDYVGQTVLAMRALQLYAPKLQHAMYEKSVHKAAVWLANVTPLNIEDLGWKVAGLAWAGGDKAALAASVKQLLALQRADGGWADLPTMETTPYATGKAMVALQIAGVAASDAAYQRGVQYLLKTQQADGSWFTKSRALAFQPYFDNGFPGGFDQWISSAATGWAAMALTYTLPEARTASAR